VIFVLTTLIFILVGFSLNLKHNKLKSDIDAKETQISSLNEKLRSTNFYRRLEKTPITAINDDAITLNDELGKALTLTVVDVSAIQETVYSADRTLKNYRDSELKAIKPGSATATVTFNGLNEIVNLIFENNIE